MNCPLCHSASKELFWVKGFAVRACLSCHHRFAAINADENMAIQVYSDAYFNSGGAGYADYIADGEILKERGRYYAKLVSRFVPKGRLLDVGAAAGFILSGFLDEGWSGIGVEINEKMARYGREHLNLQIETCSFERFQSSEKFELVSMIQVVAHFYDPIKAFQNAYALLTERGFLLVETWNYKSLTARVLGKHWHEYSPPSVLHWFSPETLTQTLSNLGFERVAIGRPKKKISGKHAKSLLEYRLGKRFATILKLIPDRVTFTYPAEDLFWALFRKR